MEKPSHSSSAVTSSSSSSLATTSAADGHATCAPCSGSKTTNSAVQSSLKSLNRASHKISKPLPRSPDPVATRIAAAAAAPPTATVSTGAGVGSGGGGPPYQPQPPVYNIDKSNFRDVVQKLTGSPAHHQTRPPPAEPSPRPPPPPAAAVPISRLHRIRPPPLAHLLHRPPTIVPAPPMHGLDPWTRPQLSPLPPLPTVSAAAESPISAYMRRLRGGPAPLPTAAAAMPPPSSPLGFGCLLSPRTAYQMMMAAPGMGLPTSPGVQVPSPRLGDP